MLNEWGLSLIFRELPEITIPKGVITGKMHFDYRCDDEKVIELFGTDRLNAGQMIKTIISEYESNG
jgi:hypothetical protein